MKNVTVRVAKQEAISYLEERLDAYNQEQPVPFQYCIRNQQQEIIAGISAYSAM